MKLKKKKKKARVTQKRMNLFMLLMALDAKKEKECPGIHGRGGSVWCIVKNFCGIVIWYTSDLYYKVGILESRE